MAQFNITGGLTQGQTSGELENSASSFIGDMQLGANFKITDYNALENKPSINGEELIGNKSLSQLGIEPAKGADDNYITDTEKAAVEDLVTDYAAGKVLSDNNFTDENSTFVSLISGEFSFVNQNKSVGTSIPTFLAPLIENSTTPKVEAIDDTFSPFAGRLSKIVKVSNTLTSGVGTYYTRYLIANKSVYPTKISISFFTRIADFLAINSAYVFKLWIYDTQFVEIPFNIATINSGGTVTVNLNNTNLLTATATAKKGVVIGDWSQVVVTIDSIAWAGSYTYNVPYIYFIYNGYPSQMLNKYVYYQNFSMLYNDDVLLSDIIYSDGLSVAQSPNTVEGLEAQIKSINTRLDNLGLGSTMLLNYDATAKTGSIFGSFDDTRTIEQRFIYKAKNNAQSAVFNFNGAYLINKSTLASRILHSNIDDVAPAKFNSTFIGANHGCALARKVTVTGHNKTFADISSSWKDSGNRIYYLIQIIDANNLLLLGENTSATDIWNFNVTITGAMTHVSGAVNTSTFTPTSPTSYQIFPAVKLVSQKIVADGVEVVSTVSSKSCAKIQFIDVYDVINPASLAAALIANKPVGGYTSNSLYDELSGITFSSRHSIVYTFTDALTCIVNTDWFNYKDVALDYFGASQAGIMTALDTGGKVHFYMPKALPVSDGVTTFDFRTAPQFTAPAAELNINSYEAGKFIDRAIELVGTTSADKTVGFSHGYLPEYSNRQSTTNKAWNISTGRKSYPYLINGGQLGATLAAKSPYSSVFFRKYHVTSEVAGRLSLCQFEFNNRHYFIADYQAAVTDNIVLPVNVIGKKLNIVEKSDNLKVLSVVSNTVTVDVASASPMYGYIFGYFEL